MVPTSEQVRICTVLVHCGALRIGGELLEPCAHRARTMHLFGCCLFPRSTMPESELPWLLGCVDILVVPPEQGGDESVVTD